MGSQTFFGSHNHCVKRTATKAVAGCFNDAKRRAPSSLKDVSNWFNFFRVIR